MRDGIDCAVRRKDGAIVAFANLWRSGDGQELSTDLMRYQPGVSKVLMDALFAHLFLYGSAQGYRWFSLGAFKEKFDPVWTPRYLACRGGLSLTRALTDVTLLISIGRSPV